MSYPWEHLIDRAWDRFASKLSAAEPLGCWPWLGGTSHGAGNTAPYGSFWVGEGFTVRAHIFASVAAGIICPTGHHRDHTCRNTLCCNPAHHEPVTPSENSRRRWE